MWHESDRLFDLVDRLSEMVDFEVGRVLADYGVTRLQYRVLTALALAAEPLCVSDLAVRCWAQQPTISKALDQLAARDLIAREVKPRDRRVTLVSLTASGRALAHSLRRSEIQSTARVLARFEANGHAARLTKLLAPAAAAAAA